MTALEQAIGYAFQNPSLLEAALTHSSFVHEHKGAGQSNERLEFLGDSVLGLVTAEYLYKTLPHKPEGELTRLRAGHVCEAALCRAAQTLDLGAFLKLGKGERASGGARRPSLLADAVEAILAAIYLDGGLPPARQFACAFLLADDGGTERDYKTELQERLQREPARSFCYNLVETRGPDHAKTFVVEVLIEGIPTGRGEGSSKKEAEQAAAKEALSAQAQ